MDPHQRREVVNQFIVGHQRRQAQLRQYLLSVIVLLIAYLSGNIASFYNRQPHHTSALTCQDWVLELLIGYPDRIQIALRVSQEVFCSLIATMCEMGLSNSCSVTLEEQLAIFLHASVTGLTVRHLGEHFQQSNEMISKYIRNLRPVLF